MPQLLSLRSRAREPQLLSPCATTAKVHVPQLLNPVCLEPVLCSKRSHSNEKPGHRNERDMDAIKAVWEQGTEQVSSRDIPGP